MLAQGEAQRPKAAEQRMSPRNKRRLVVLVAGILLAVLVIALVLGGALKGKKAPQAAMPPEVEVVQVEQRDVPIYGEWIGTLVGMVDADVKAQVQGYLLTKNYTEGSSVRKGQLLFQIDPRPFQAALAQARGQLAQAQG